MPEVDKPTMSCEPGEFLPDPSNCNAFYQCVLGEQKKQYCAGGLHWNRDKKICDWPAEAKCNEQKRNYNSRLLIQNYFLVFSASYKPTTVNWQQTKTTPAKTSIYTTTRSTTQAVTIQDFPQYTEAASAEVQEGCTTGAYYPHADCTHFYVCFNNELVPQPCAPGLMYDTESRMCDWSFKVKCGQRKKIAEKYTAMHRMSVELKESK